jgi:hypothetical protein
VNAGGASPSADTVDLFLLDAAASTITSAAASFETAIGERGWSHQRVIDQSDFVRLLITGSRESLIVDLGRDSPPPRCTRRRRARRSPRWRLGIGPLDVAPRRAVDPVHQVAARDDLRLPRPGSETSYR